MLVIGGLPAERERSPGERRVGQDFSYEKTALRGGAVCYSQAMNRRYFLLNSGLIAASAGITYLLSRPRLEHDHPRASMFRWAPA
jgi:hypothetical protein